MITVSQLANKLFAYFGVTDTPTAATNLAVQWEYNDVDYEVSLWDTAGQESLRSLRTVAYPGTQVLRIVSVICFELYTRCQLKAATGLPIGIRHDTCKLS